MLAKNLAALVNASKEEEHFTLTRACDLLKECAEDELADAMNDILTATDDGERVRGIVLFAVQTLRSNNADFFATMNDSLN